MSNSSIAPCQTTIVATSTTTAGIQSRTCRAARRPYAGVRRSALIARRSMQRGLLLGQQVLAAAAQQLAHLGHELEEARLLARLDRARVRQVDRRRSRRSGPGRGLITTTRVERKTASEIECVTKTTVEPSCCQIESSSRLSRSRVISSSAPNGSSISSSAGSNASARAIDDALLHAARELPRMVVAEAGQLDELEHLARRAPCAARGPSRASRAAARCSSPPCASRTAPRPGRRSRSRGRARACCADLPLTVDRAGRRLDEVADHAQERRLAAARRADQRDELARLELRGRCPAAP